ncbi:hypothetical protein [Rhodoferax sediminis]|uniref:Uncharacterized protein n=1 Tax=Rhodoferax sediminis TaxID=2509614 RepID=A0A515DDQ8_9BURK|nr:hypothetical protein [Rhodoferax sediminis]QDL38544.1 hypothetical protein EUB48_15540 [Rhodoferax sediminis]
MTSIANTLRAIEARAERAIVQELRLMTQEILAMRTVLVLEDRSHADALLLKLDRLAQDQTAAPASSNDTPASLMPDLRLDEIQALAPVAYKVYFYGRACGDLEDVVTLDAFDAGVQLVLDRVDAHRGHAIEASWANGRGALKVLTPTGATLATIEAADVVDVSVDPIVDKVCQALQLGDASRIEKLFGPMLKAA